MFAIGATVKEYHVWINGLFALVGVAWAAINVNSYPMVVEMSKGSDIGKFTGFYYTFSMAAQIVTPILSGFLLEHVGYFILFPYAAHRLLHHALRPARGQQAAPEEKPAGSL